MKQMQFQGMKTGGDHKTIEDEEQTFLLALRDMGKYLHNITTEAIKAYAMLCRNCSLQGLVLNLKLWGDPPVSRPSSLKTAALISQSEQRDIKDREVSGLKKKGMDRKRRDLFKKGIHWLILWEKGLYMI